MRLAGADIPAPKNSEFWIAYALFLKSEKQRHLDDVKMIEARLEGIKRFVPQLDNLPSDIWVDQNDVKEFYG